MIAEVILSITLSLILARTLFAMDAIRDIRGYKSVVCRAAKAAHSLQQPSSSSQGGRRPSLPSNDAVSTPRARTHSAGSPQVRFLHITLLVTHVVSVMAVVAALFKYTLPVTVENCTATHKVLVSMLLLYDASLLTFLLAKVHVTNGHRKLAWWETAIVWISRGYAWIYLPIVAVAIPYQFRGGTNDERTFCINGYNMDDDADEVHENIRGYGSNMGSLIIQFVLLLILFVRPLLVRLEGSQSGEAIYRRVVIKNITCTIAVVTAYAVTTVVVIAALLRQNNDSNTIALPLGFTSCWKACSLELCTWPSSSKEGPSDLETAMTGDSSGSGTAANNHNRDVP
ncbi:expressed unknown protein [Ectocarpus siliculosus]|uniref:Uncharacterized protein n=1 Tax=Ectocarpus siliculosus TaxID=2880 RepID=D8LG96_ECTSI|nr:expressed unknown protein [Ectocarpus siliculosus]|eukprot:CBN78995.1 expressed unknown protein [Ectocarpus siliculosus]